MDVSPGRDTAAPSQEPGVTRRSWITLLAVALGIMVIQLDGTIVSVANPAIASDLAATPAQIQWVTTGYLLVFAGLLIPAGTVADRLGHRRVFLVGVVGFTLASLLCGISANVEMLIASRVLQAVFAAAIGPAGLALIRSAFPAAALPRALGIFGAVTAVALASGPLLGGALMAVGSWHLVFLVNLPLGLVAVVVGMRVLDRGQRRTQTRSDVAGAVTLVAAMVATIWGVTSIQENGWTAGTFGFLGAGLVLVAVFLRVEGRVREPMVPLRLFRDRQFAVGCVLSVITLFVFFAIMFYLTFFFQGVQGKSAVATGVALLPLTAVFTSTSPLAGAATARLGSRATVLMGAAGTIAALVLLLGLSPQSSALSLTPALLLAGAGAGFLLVPAITLVVGGASEEQAGVASGIQQASQQLGGTLGIAVFGSVISSLVAGTFTRALASTDVPSSTAADLAADPAVLEGVALGFPAGAQDRLAAALGGEVAADVTDAAHATFLASLDGVFLVAIATVLAGAVLALLVRRVRQPEGSAVTPL